MERRGKRENGVEGVGAMGSSGWSAMGDGEEKERVAGRRRELLKARGYLCWLYEGEIGRAHV